MSRGIEPASVPGRDRGGLLASSLATRSRGDRWGAGSACSGLTPQEGRAIIRRRLDHRWPGGFKLDDKLHHMLRDLRRALSEAISESSEVSRTLRKIREEGYSLYLLVDCKREPSEAEALALPASRQALGPASSSPSAPATEPAFQIDGRDLSFLKSIGIDPTRRMRRRRST